MDVRNVATFWKVIVVKLTRLLVKKKKHSRQLLIQKGALI